MDVNPDAQHLLKPLQLLDVSHFTSMMQKISIAILIVLLSFGAVNAQQLIYSQNFEDSTQLFQDYVLADLDYAKPADAGWDTLTNTSWIVRKVNSGSNHAAMATSKYNPAAAADDWFITPAIRLGKASKLSWKSLSLTSGTTDTYQVFVSTTEQSVAGCLFNGAAASYSSSDAVAFTSHTLDLSNSDFANRTVFIGFRLNTQSGGDRIAIDDIAVTEDSTQFQTLKFVVNMSNYIAAKKFHPRTDTVDIAGTFNKFIGTKNILSIVPNSDSSVYTTSVFGFLDGDRLEFKFRINSTWNDTSVEFPYGKPNRVWVVEHNKYTYTCFYNYQGTPFGIPEISGMDQVKVSPNPASERISIEFPDQMNKIVLASITGKEIMQYNPVLTNRVDMDVHKLQSGTYLLLFYTKNGFVGSEKLIKH